MPDRGSPRSSDGVRHAMADGLLGGHPVVDVRSPCSTARRTRTTPASSRSDRGHDGVQGGGAGRAPVVLEPIMGLEVTCRDEDVGAVIGDIGRRRDRARPRRAHSERLVAA